MYSSKKNVYALIWWQKYSHYVTFDFVNLHVMHVFIHLQTALI